MNKFDRRDFLKLLGISPISFILNPNCFSSCECVTRNNNLPNILILVFDTLSAKNMSLYGYRRGTTPNFERFAQKATVFHRHYAAGNFTTPGTTSILTGVYPWSHRALQLHSQPLKCYQSQNLFSLLNDEYYSFAYTHNPMVYILLQYFRKNIDRLVAISDLCLISDSFSDKWMTYDYKTAYDAELLLYRNGYFPSASLFGSIFDWIRRINQNNDLDKQYKDLFPRGVPNYMDEEFPSFLKFILEDTIDWLQTKVQSQPSPYLGYIHMLPPHGPYTTRRNFIDIFKDDLRFISKPEHHFTEFYTQEFLDQERSYYDESIAYVDAEFGRLYDFMVKNHVLEDTYVIVTADHGEMFERGIYTHTTPTLYEPIIHIPLLISIPDQQKRVDIYSPTNSVDLLPTILKINHTPVPAWIEGQVLPIFSNNNADLHRNIFAVEAKENPKHVPLHRVTITTLREEYKLIYYLGYENFSQVFELYNIRNDPEELVNLYTPDNPIAMEMKQIIMEQLSFNDQPLSRCQ